MKSLVQEFKEFVTLYVFFILIGNFFDLSNFFSIAGIIHY